MTDPHPETAEQVVERTLADCGGNAAAALLLLAHLLNAAGWLNRLSEFVDA